VSLDTPPNPAEEAVTSLLTQLDSVVKEHFSGPASDVRLHHDLTERIQNAGLVLRALGAAHHRTGDDCNCTPDRFLAV